MYNKNYFNDSVPSLSETNFNALIKRLEIESSEYWEIINGYDESIDEIIAWAGLIKKVKEIYFEVDLYDHSLLYQVVKQTQARRDEKTLEKDWNYEEENPLKNSRNRVKLEPRTFGRGYYFQTTIPF